MTKSFLVTQFDTAWKLTAYHLETLSTEECLWRPAEKGLHISRDENGHWRADWPEEEGYDIGPASIGWITWHMCYWWRMVMNHSFHTGTLTKQDIEWPGSADAARETLEQLSSDWRVRLESLSDGELASPALTRWPMQDRPFGDVVAWVNIELMKNAAELGYARFLYATKEG